MKAKHFALLTLVAVALLLGVALFSQATPLIRNIRFDSQDGAPILSLGRIEGSAGSVTMLRQYASGSAVIEKTFFGNVRPPTQRPGMSVERLSEILETISRFNLRNYSESEIRKRIGARPGEVTGSLAAPTDAGVFVVEFSLAIENDSTGETQLVSKKIYLPAPDVLEIKHPTISEFKGIAKLERIFVEELAGGVIHENH